MSTTARTAPQSTRLGSPSQKRNYLQEIRTEVDKRPIAGVFAGVPGIGKTSLAASMPGVIVMHTADEDGITTLKTYGQVPTTVPQLPPVRSWGDALDMVDWLTTSEHPHKVLALDAMAGFERLCHEEVCRRDYRGEWGDKGFGSYQKGFDTAVTDWRQFLGNLDKLRDAKGMSIIWLAHTKVKNFRNPEGPDFDRYIPDVHEKTWAATHKWADMVLFLNFVIVVNKDGKGEGGNQRTMFTQYHPAYEAKNRLGLPAEIDMGDSGREAWANLSAAVKAAQAKDGE